MLCVPLQFVSAGCIVRLPHQTNPPCCTATASVASDSGSELTTNPEKMVFRGHQSATFVGAQGADGEGTEPRSQHEIMDQIPL